MRRGHCIYVKEKMAFVKNRFHNSEFTRSNQNKKQMQNRSLTLKKSMKIVSASRRSVATEPDFLRQKQK